jgi:hypothetical protein
MKQIYSSITKLLVSIFFLHLVITTANAQWATDPTVNNVVCTAAGNQSGATMTSDGSGGAIIVWTDNNSDIYAQRINSNGTVQWIARGVAICTDAQVQVYQQIVSDGSGGAIITWQDYRSSDRYNIYAQLIDASGVTKWAANGVAICTAGTTGYGSTYPRIISDGAGGAIIIWQDFRDNSLTGRDIYAQKINANGIVQWTPDGVAICTAASSQDDPQICSDGAGGAIITWGDGRPAYNGDIYAQRIDADGVVKWTANGVVVFAGGGIQRYPQICSDGTNGAIITWSDSWNGNDDIFAQRMAPNGSLLWAVNGVSICLATSSQQYPQISSDGSGGAIIAWYDYRKSNLDADIYAQRINAGGTVQYIADGTAICTAVGHQYSPRIITDGSTGAIITWYDYRISTLNPNIYAQRTNTSGVVQWPVNGVEICTNLSSQTLPQIVSDGSGGAIITWDDVRGGSSNYNLYAQQVGANGVIGNIATGIKEQSEMIPGVNLDQNFPNPFEQITKIRYEISIGQMVTLKVYDLFGKEIKTLVHEIQPAGKYIVDFNASGNTPGVYVYKLQSGSSGTLKKMIILK